MSTRTESDGDDPIIEQREQLIALFQNGEKPPERWKIGTEHEKFVYSVKDHHAPGYEEQGGIHTLLIGLTRYGWEPVFEGGTSSRSPARTARSVLSRRGSWSCPARRSTVCTRPAPRPGGISNR